MSKILAAFFSVLTNIYIVPETQCLEYLMAITKTVMDFGSKMFLVAAIISSQYFSTKSCLFIAKISKKAFKSVRKIYKAAAF